MADSTERGGIRIDDAGQSYELGYELLIFGEPKLTIVLLNGSLFNMRQWDTFIKYGFSKAFSSGVRIIRYDYGGTGRSLRNPVQWNVFSLAHELIKLFNALGLDQAHVYGVSKGTIVGQVFAALYPERVQSLAGYGWFHFGYSRMAAVARFFGDRVKCFEALGQQPPVVLKLGQFSELWDLAYQIVLSQTREQIPSFLTYFLHRVVKRRAFNLLEPTPARVMFDWFSYAVQMMPSSHAQFEQYYPKLEELPILLQHGRHDTTLPFEMALELHKLLPHTELIEYGRGYNHVSPLILPLQARRVATDYEHFLKKVVSNAPTRSVK